MSSVLRHSRHAFRAQVGLATFAIFTYTLRSLGKGGDGILGIQSIP